MAEGTGAEGKGAGVAGSVIVEIGGNLAPLEAKLAEARRLISSFDTQMSQGLSSSSTAALAKVGAVATDAGAALTKVTAPATAAVAKIDQMGKAAVMAAAGVKDLTAANAGLAGGADAAGAGMERASYSAKELSAALAATGGNLDKALVLMTANADGATKLAAVQTEVAATTQKVATVTREATATMQASGVAATETAALSTRAARELLVVFAEFQRGNWNRIPGSLAVLSESLLKSGASALSLANIFKLLGTVGAVAFNPIVLGVLAASFAFEQVTKGIEGMTHGSKQAADATAEWRKEVDQLLEGYTDAKKAADEVIAAATTIPRGVAVSDLQTNQADFQKQLDERLEMVKAFHAEDAANQIQVWAQLNSLNIDQTPGLSAAMAQAKELEDLKQKAIAAGPALDGVKTELEKLINSHPDAGVLQIAQSFKGLLDSVTAAEAGVVSSGAASDKLQKETADYQALGDALDRLSKIGVPALTATQKAQDDLNDALAHASGFGAGSIDNIAASYNDAKARLAQADALKQTEAAAKKFTDTLAKLNAETRTATFERMISGLSASDQALAKAADSAGLVDRGIVALMAALHGDWGLSGIKALIGQMGQLTAATNQAAAAKAALAAQGGTNYSVPSSTGGSANVTVYRPGPTQQGGYAPNVTGGIGVNVGGEFPDGGGPITSTIDPTTGITVERGNPVSTYGYNPVYGPNPYAVGGHVKGPGTGTSDSIFARLSNGEFVMSAAATSKYLGILNAMNDNRFATGGFVVPGGAHATTPATATYPAHDIGTLMGLLRQGIDLSQIDGITTSGGSKVGTTTTTNFNFTQGSAASLNPNNDPGLAAFDSAHPNWAAEVAASLPDARGSLLYGGNPSRVMESFRAAHATYFQNALLAAGGDNSAAFAYAWASGQGLQALPDARQSGLSISGMPYDRQTTTGFATGGAILPGPDSQVVKFNKSPDEMVGVFTPSQRKAIGDAVDGKAGDTFNNVFHLNIGQVNTQDGRLSSQSRAEMQDIMKRAVRSAFNPRGR